MWTTSATNLANVCLWHKIWRLKGNDLFCFKLCVRENNTCEHEQNVHPQVGLTADFIKSTNSVLLFRFLANCDAACAIYFHMHSRDTQAAFFGVPKVCLNLDLQRPPILVIYSWFRYHVAYPPPSVLLSICSNYPDWGIFFTCSYACWPYN